MKQTKLIQKVSKGHKQQMKLARSLSKVGYNTALGKLLRLKAYYSDGLIMLRAWRDFLAIRKKEIGNTYFAVDHAVIKFLNARLQVKRLS